jgi:hypothetical protein
MSNEYKDWKIDRIEEEKQILEKYPFLAERTLDGEIDTEAEFPMICLEIPNGWYRLFYQMCDDIKPILEREGLMDKFYFAQVKEKFNQLRCYANIDVPEVDEIIAKYEFLATNVCVRCGAPAEYETTGYIASICGDCRNGYFQAQKCNDLEIQTSYISSFFANKKSLKLIDVEISFEEEWQRYLDKYYADEERYGI